MTIPVPGPWVYAEHAKTHRMHLLLPSAMKTLCGTGLEELIVEDELTESGERATCSQCRKRAELEPIELLGPRGSA